MNPSATALTLKSGPLRLVVCPELGGCLAGLWHGDTPVLRSQEAADLQTSRESACYPLVPYSNRLGFRRFRWQGRDHVTQPNFDDSPHSVHGVAWQRPWTVTEQGADHATLIYTHASDDHWPFDFTVTQTITLRDQALEMSLAFTNTSAQSQPVGLGWHPYFPKRSRSRLHAEVSARWESDPGTGLPTRPVSQTSLDGDIAHLNFDHCFDGWQGAVRIRDEKLSMRLQSTLTRLVVYTPPNKPYFCVEPVSHVSNAIHMADPVAHGLLVVQPGDTVTATMTLDVNAV